MGIARIQCYFGRHTRSRGRARRAEYGWHSYCRRCGVEMIKQDGGDWIVVDQPEIVPAEMAGDTIYVGAALHDEPVVTLEDGPPPSRARFGRLLRRKN